MHLTPDHPQARELDAINRILDKEPTTAALIHQGLCRGRELADTGSWQSFLTDWNFKDIDF
jgi:hypothetical protein